MSWLWAIPALPVLGALVLGLAGPALGTRNSAIIGTASVGLAALVAIMIGVGWALHPPPGGVFVQTLWTWISLPGLTIRFGLLLDPLSLLMVLVVTIVGSLIHLFSTAYMRGEAGFSRYFAWLNLFVAAMLLLVLADDLAVLFIGWEGVGVCSYLLVGFWFDDPANGAAAQKSFIVTRIADIAMLAGLLVLATQLGTLNIAGVLAGAAAWPPGSGMAEVAAALLLVGGLGKSAQVPLHTWLPDAMAGPTPVSALIHAATMVTAGVYLVVRLHHEQNIFAMGGLWRRLPAAFAGFVVGAASLAALPLVSAGFFSKDMILGVLWSAQSPALWAAALVGALLTSVYAFRLVFTVFFGPVVTPPSGAYGVRIVLPLALLSAAALTIGWLETPTFLGGRHLISGWLQPAGAAVGGVVPGFVQAAGVVVPLAGIAVAWGLHRNGTWRAQAARTPTPPARVLAAAGGFDALYDALLVRPYRALVAVLRDDPADQLSTWLEQGAAAVHRRLRATQTGQLRRYAAWMMAGAVATIAAVLFA